MTVLKWFVSRENRSFRWSLIGSFFMGIGAVAGISVGISQIPGVGGHEKAGGLTPFDAAIFCALEVVAIFGFLGVVRLKAQLIRLDRRLAIEHAAYYRSRLEGEFAQKELQLLTEHSQWELERDEWKAKTQNELYQLILDQVDRGILGPRPNLRDDD